MDIPAHAVRTVQRRQTIDVIRARRVTDPTRLRDLARLLDSHELGRAARFRADRDRDLFVTGRGALRKLLARRLGISPADVPLGESGGGRPEWRHPAAPVVFSISHSGEWVAIAIGTRGPLGVAIEEHSPAGDHGKLVLRYFSQTEMDTWRALPQDSRIPAFYHAWTQKKAVLKGMGTGLATDLATFSVEVDPHRSPRVVEAPDPSVAWSLTAIPVPGYSCTVAVGGTADVRASAWDG